jgi:hypothetical protein
MAGGNTSDKTHRSRRNTGSFDGQPEKRVRERQRAGQSGFHGDSFFPWLPATQYPLSERDFASWPVGTEQPDLEAFLSKSQLKISASAIGSARWPPSESRKDKPPPLS